MANGYSQIYDYSIGVVICFWRDGFAGIVIAGATLTLIIGLLLVKDKNKSKEEK